MLRASSCSPKKTVPAFSFSSSAASSSLCVRTMISTRGLTARALDMRLDEHGRVGGVAGDRRYVFCAQFLNDLAILLGHDKGYTLRGQSFSDAPAHSAVAD